MRTASLALLSLALAFVATPAAFAKPGARKPSPSRSMDPAAFAACVETRIVGRDDTECRRTPDDPQCTGLRKALTYVTRRDECLTVTAGGCARRGYAGLDQAQWASAAAGHLAELKECVTQRYGSTDGNEPFAAALADPGFQALLADLDDGSRALGLKGGTVVRRSLDPERFASTLSQSPFGDATDTASLFTIREGADNPLALHGPAQEANVDPGLPRDRTLATQLQAYRDSQETAVPAESAAARKPAWPAHASPTDSASARAPASKGASRGARSPYSLGLDRTLFERVNDAYARQGDRLRGFENYVRDLPPPARARDLGELLRKGEAL